MVIDGVARRLQLQLGLMPALWCVDKHILQ